MVTCSGVSRMVRPVCAPLSSAALLHACGLCLVEEPAPRLQADPVSPMSLLHAGQGPRLRRAAPPSLPRSFAARRPRASCRLRASTSMQRGSGSARWRGCQTAACTLACSRPECRAGLGHVVRLEANAGLAAAGQEAAVRLPHPAPNALPFVSCSSCPHNWHGNPLDVNLPVVNAVDTRSMLAWRGREVPRDALQSDAHQCCTRRKVQQRR